MVRVSVALGRALLQMTRLPKAPDDPGPLRRGAITGVVTGLGGMLRAHRDRFHPLSLHGRQTRQHHRPGRIGGDIVFAIGVWLGRIGAA